jgi:flagellar biogenesis protein FliO
VKNVIPGFFLLLALSFGHAGFAADDSSPEASGATNSAIPYKTEESGAGKAAGSAFAALVGVIGVACLGLLAAKRYFPKLSLQLKLPLPIAANRRMKVVESLRLGAKASLYLVQWDQRTFLIAQSGETVTLIADDDAVSSDREHGRGNANDA